MFAKDFVVDFFTVQMPEKAPSFEAILRKHSHERGESLWLFRRSDVVGVFRCSQGKNGIHEFEAVRLRMGDGAMKGKLTETELTEIALGENEGLAESTAVLYHAPTRVLAIQRNRVGVTASSLSWYFEEKAEVKPILLLPCVREEAYQRLADVKRVSRFQLRVAGITDPGIFKDDNRTGEQLLTLARDLGAPEAELTLSLGRGGHDRSLNKNRVVAAARAFYARVLEDESPVKKLRITGETADDQITMLDLIEDRLVEKMEVQSVERTLPYLRRRNWVKEAWNKHKEELSRILAVE